jgi:hypothetical protein
MTIKRLKELLQCYKDEYEVCIIDNVIEIKGKVDADYIHREYINSAGGVWEGGCGMAPDGSLCGECSTFNCDKCGGWKRRK